MIKSLKYRDFSILAMAIGSLATAPPVAAEGADTPSSAIHAGSSDYGVAGVVVPGSEGRREATFRKPNFRVALDHNFTPDVLGHFSWTRGFNSGFFDQLSGAGFIAAADPAVLPEEIDAYEVGMKGEFLDHRFRVNPQNQYPI